MNIKSLVLAISSVLCTTAVWADNTVTTTTQGNYNTLSAEQQGGDGNSVSITQTTDNNQSSTSQNGSSNSVFITQYADGYTDANGSGVATISQAGFSNSVGVTQDNHNYYGNTGYISNLLIDQQGTINSTGIFQGYQLGTNGLSVRHNGCKYYPRFWL